MSWFAILVCMEFYISTMSFGPLKVGPFLSTAAAVKIFTSCRATKTAAGAVPRYFYCAYVVLTCSLQML